MNIFFIVLQTRFPSYCPVQSVCFKSYFNSSKILRFFYCCRDDKAGSTAALFGVLLFLASSYTFFWVVQRILLLFLFIRALSQQLLRKICILVKAGIIIIFVFFLKSFDLRSFLSHSQFERLFFATIAIFIAINSFPVGRANTFYNYAYLLGM